MCPREAYAEAHLAGLEISFACNRLHARDLEILPSLSEIRGWKAPLDVFFRHHPEILQYDLSPNWSVRRMK